MEMNRRSFVALTALSAAVAAPAARAASNGQATVGQAMRRKDRGLNQDEIDFLLENTLHCVLSTCDNAGNPYGVAVSPIRLNGKFYFHCSNGASRKMANMRQNPRVSLFFIGSDKADEPVFALNFASVIVTGTAKELHDQQQIGEIMTRLCQFQCPDGPMDYAAKHWMNDKNSMTMWEITPTAITGKARKKQRYFKNAPLGGNCKTDKA